MNIMTSYLKGIVINMRRIARQKMVDLCPELPGSVMLDCGCGAGELTMEIAGKLKTDKIFGFDLGADFVEQAKLQGINAVCHDFNKPFPYDDQSFDVVCASTVIEITTETDGFLREINRVLRSSRGYLLLSTPNLSSFHNILFLMAGKLPAAFRDDSEMTTRQPGILSQIKIDQVTKTAKIRRKVFTPGALCDLLKYHGFEVQKIKGCGFHPFPSSLSKLLSTIDRQHATYIIVLAKKV